MGCSTMIPAPTAPAAFPATRWSLICSMKGADAARALAELCHLYWLPLYTFCRYEGLATEDAEDLTQEFFRRLLEEDAGWLRTAGPERGRLRTLLIRVLRRRIVDFHRRAGREKRGGGRVLSLDVAGAEALMTTCLTANAEEEFDRHWASTVLDLALQRLEADCQAAERQAQFGVLLGFLGLDGAEADVRQVETALGLSAAAARQTVARFRERFRSCLRQVIADTLCTPSEEAVDAELLALRAALQRGLDEK